jgi:hypothetical protein
MNCTDCKAKLPGFVLDDLDVEERREVEKHLGSCAACRAERDALAMVHGAMKSVPDVETSQARRDAVAGAMAAARQEILERAMVAPKPSRWKWISAAAAVVVAAVGLFVGYSMLAGPTYRIASGTGVIIRPDGTSTAAAGAVLRRGDRVVADESVRLESADVVIDVTGTLSIQPSELLLERGRMSVEVRRGEVVVADLSSDRLVLRAGRFNVEVYQAKGVVLDSPNAEPKRESMPRLRGRVLEGSAHLEGQKSSVVVNPGEAFSIDAGGYTDRKKE